jgi:hypothetical protein
MIGDLRLVFVEIFKNSLNLNIFATPDAPMGMRRAFGAQCSMFFAVDWNSTSCPLISPL